MNLYSTKWLLVICFVIIGVVGCNRGPEDVSINIKPGEYEINITKTHKGKEDPKKITNTTCFAEAKFDPFNVSGMKDTCKMVNINKVEETVSFDVECNEPDGSIMKHSYEYGANGEKLTWTIKGFENDEVLFETKGTGQYVGECPQSAN